jgi:hypothetical protein
MTSVLRRGQEMEEKRYTGLIAGESSHNEACV